MNRVGFRVDERNTNSRGGPPLTRRSRSIQVTALSENPRMRQGWTKPSEVAFEAAVISVLEGELGDGSTWKSRVIQLAPVLARVFAVPEGADSGKLGSHGPNPGAHGRADSLPGGYVRAMHRRMDSKPWTWLVVGTLATAAAHMTLGLGVLAWFAPLPFLHYLRLTRGWKSRCIFTAASFCAWLLAILKIVSAPLPAIAAVAWALPFSVVLAWPYIAWDHVRRRLGEGPAGLAFATFMVVSEWSLHGVLPLGIWGSAANTQLDQIALLQLSSITGLHGLSFLLYVFAATLSRVLQGERASVYRAGMLVTAAVVAAIAFGQARLGVASATAAPTRLVAAVGTDSIVGTKPDLPGPERPATVERELVRRTEIAANAGAELVVWTEAATMVVPQNEQAWRTRLQALAARLGVDLVAAYVVPLTTDPLYYENKYAFIRADGSIDHSYLKHRPVPGEPAVPGEGPMPLAVDDQGRGEVAGAICYDYDFPRLALENARNGADLIALPSSDWRGIDPIHTHMAAIRAIEGGTSILRSTRFGLSAGIDPWGRLRGWDSAWDNEDRVLLVRLPRRGVTTLYSQLGDWFPAVCLVLSAWLLIRSRRRALLSRN